MYTKLINLIGDLLELIKVKRDKRLTTKDVAWIDQARKLQVYLEEATEFIDRSGEDFCLSTGDALAIAYLWLEADGLDALICSFLGDLNIGLLDSNGEIEVTRGVSLNTEDSIEQDSVYDCSWSLLWNHQLGIKISLITTPTSFRSYEIKVTSKKARTGIHVSYPVEDSKIKEAIISAYLSDSAQQTVNNGG